MRSTRPYLCKSMISSVSHVNPGGTWRRNRSHCSPLRAGNLHSGHEARSEYLSSFSLNTKARTQQPRWSWTTNWRPWVQDSNNSRRCCSWCEGRNNLGQLYAALDYRFHRYIRIETRSTIQKHCQHHAPLETGCIPYVNRRLLSASSATLLAQHTVIQTHQSNLRMTSARCRKTFRHQASYHGTSTGTQLWRWLVAHREGLPSWAAFCAYTYQTATL